MYCTYCGNQLDNNAVVCEKCARAPDPLSAPRKPSKLWSGLAMALLILGILFIPVIGLPFGFIGLFLRRKRKQAIVLILLSVTMLMVWNGKYPNSDWSRRYQEFTGSWSGPEIYAEVIYETNLLKKMYPGILPSTMGFTISNENHFEWTDVELTINSTLLSGGYTYQCTQIKANGATWAPAHEFSNAEGYRFDSDSMKPNTLIIQCATPNGRTSKKFEFQ